MIINTSINLDVIGLGVLVMGTWIRMERRVSRIEGYLKGKHDEDDICGA